MIASPCKTCTRKNEPKDKCIKDCSELKAVQDMQLVQKDWAPSLGIDFTEDHRFSVWQRDSLLI